MTDDYDQTVASIDRTWEEVDRLFPDKVEEERVCPVCQKKIPWIKSKFTPHEIAFSNPKNQTTYCSSKCASKAQVGKIVSSEVLEIVRQSILKAWKDPELIENQIRKHREQWKDPNFQKKMREACNRRPNNLEIEFNLFLQALFPGDWEYVGDWKFWIAGKNPDFKHTSRNILIEVYGDYYHEGQNPEERISYFRKQGYECLVIWEHEFLEEKTTVVRKILDFTGKNPLECLALTVNYLKKQAVKNVCPAH